ncbi:uncharacterized protein LOC125462346 isoform X2 [Stegostoma tigrinum]|nr:uncharacterized protein LOC125462346 isoform X2 [Stegostoma tigrinum]XP_048408262.1 uncharacterized protein LOC125462346 isoform X2 [Stegostoma tigrinum]
MNLVSAIWCLFIFGFQLCLASNDDQPKLLECYSDYLKEIICTWNVGPNANCSTDYSLKCKLMIDFDEICNVMDIKTLPKSTCQCRITKPTLVFSADYEIMVLFKGTVVLSKLIRPSQTIKPLAPHNLMVNISADKQHFLVWDDDYNNTFIEKYLEYQIAYMKTGGNWKTINTTNQKMLALQSVLDPGYIYHMKVRSKPLPEYHGAWSDWSSECLWFYGSSDFVSTALIVFVCIIIPVPVAICFFGFKFVKKNWWEDIPRPQPKDLSKENFDKLQKNGHIFNDDMLDDCKVEQVLCTNQLPQGKNRIENIDDRLCTVNIPVFQPLMEVSNSNDKFPFPLFPGFNFPVLKNSLSPFSLPFEDLPFSTSEDHDYSLFKSVVKDQQEDKYHPFTVNEDRDSPLKLSTYSLCPDADSTATGSSDQTGYKSFSNCVSEPWTKSAQTVWNPGEQQISEVFQPQPESGEIESSDYMSSDKLTFKSSNNMMPDWEGDKIHNTSCDFTVDAGIHFPVDPFLMFPESLQSSALPLNAQTQWWHPVSIHEMSGTTESDFTPHLMTSQDCCLKQKPALGAMDQGNEGQVESDTPGNTEKKTQMKYIVVPEDTELGLGELTPYMKLSLLNVQATDKIQLAEPIHPLTKHVYLNDNVTVIQRDNILEGE